MRIDGHSQAPLTHFFTSRRSLAERWRSPSLPAAALVASPPPFEWLTGSPASLAFNSASSSPSPAQLNPKP